MKSNQYKRIFIEIIASLFILLFVYTALNKIYEHEKFIAVLQRSPLIKEYAVLLSYLLPATELIISILLFFPKTRIAGFWGSLILMSSFTVYIGYMIRFTPHLPCSCGGVLKQLTWKEHLIFNLFFTVLALSGVILYRMNVSGKTKRTVLLI